MPGPRIQKVYKPVVLANYLNDIIRQDKTRDIPKKRPVYLPMRKDLPMLGTVLSDIMRLDAKTATKEIDIMKVI